MLIDSSKTLVSYRTKVMMNNLYFPISFEPFGGPEVLKGFIFDLFPLFLSGVGPLKDLNIKEQTESSNSLIRSLEIQT